MQIIELPSAVKELYERSGSTVSIAKIFGVSSATVWRHLRKLGVCVRTKSEAAKLGVKMGRIKIKKHTISPPSKILTRKKSYLIGVLCGDGYLSYISKKGSYHIGLQAIDKEFVEKFAEYLYKVYGIKIDVGKVPARTPGWSNQFRAGLYCKAAYDDLLRYCTSYKTFEWRVPEAIKRASPEIISEFIKGFADSEGDIDKDSRRIGLTSVRKEGLEEIRLLLGKFGIRSTIQTRKASGSRKECYQLRIQDRKSVEKFEAVIGFSIERKRKTLRDCIKSYKRYVTPHVEAEKLHPKLLELRKQGYSFAEMSKKSGLSIGTVWRYSQRT